MLSSLATILLTTSLVLPVSSSDALSFPAAGSRLRVITTTADLAAITRAVGGDFVEVESIARGYQDPHYVEVKPSFMVRLNRADLLLHIGMELEIGWLPLLLQGSRNPDLRVVPVSRDIEVLQVPEGEVSRRQGDVHPEGNPHFWLDPRHGQVMADQIAEVLMEMLPSEAHPGIYANLGRFRQDLEQRIIEWEERLVPWRGLEVVAYHQQYEYLLAWAGWKTTGYIEEKPGIPPAPRHIAALEEMMVRDSITTIISSNYIAPRIPDRIAGRTGSRYIVLPASVDGLEGIDDYLDLFETIITIIESEIPHPAGKNRWP